MISIFKRFGASDRGNVAIIFALAIIPVFGAVGAAIDYSRASEVRSKLAYAVDAGVLAVGSQPPMSDDEAYDTVERWVDTHMGPKYANDWTLDSVIQEDDGVILASASGSVETTISRVLGITEIPITVKSEAVRSIGKIEVALVLDTTGSMRGTKLVKLKEAANALVDALDEASSDPEDLKIGLVPFSQTVKVGSAYKNASWLDAEGRSDSAKSLFLGREVNRFDLFEAMGETWGGCVETRAMPYEPTMTAATPGNPNSLYVPYFAPDEPGDKGEGRSRYDHYRYNNSYIDDSSKKKIRKELKRLGLNSALSLPDFRLLQGDILKYRGSPYNGTTSAFGYEYGPNSGCELGPLQRLTHDPETAKDAIDEMVAIGNTDIPIGATWGWNVLSHEGPFGDGVAPDDPDWTKIMVLMTDGNNEAAVGNSENYSYYSGVGYVWQERMGVPANNRRKSDRTTARDARLDDICDAMKAEGIVIYTIRVEVRDGSSDVLEDCASSDDKFYEVDNIAELNATFDDIGNSIQKLRLAR